jgi:formate hydrogenlyase transcriptional activator
LQSANEELENAACKNEDTSLLLKLGRSIVGKSPGLKEALHQAAIVAPTDSTALIFGETGTGKELVTRAVHELSSRRDKPLVRLNCAALPTGLLESELFGYERGAFTGAVARKAGRFELADQGTLFLDEVGDIPLEVQPKLLRALQEQEFERLGSTLTTRVNVRVVAATSRDLPQLVQDGQFRSDLYYRLNVFPIRVPPLRERLEDIPLLVQHFVAQFARAMNKRIDSVPVEFINALTARLWPGNVRELENFIERAVILSQDRVLHPPIDCVGQVPPLEVRQIPKRTTLMEVEREHILLALRDADWVVGGLHGAAHRLGLKRTTLAAKMKKLGISRPPRRAQPLQRSGVFGWRSQRDLRGNDSHADSSTIPESAGAHPRYD